MSTKGIDFMNHPGFQTALKQAVIKAMKANDIDASISQSTVKPTAKDIQLSTSQPTLKPTAKDIGYFDPTATAAVKEIGIYNDVYEFVDRLEICMQSCSDKDVRDVIPECLRGDALNWFTELNTVSKALLERFFNLKKWTWILTTRFGLAISSTLTRMNGIKYKLEDARCGLTARHSYAYYILKLARHVEGIIASVKTIEYLYWNLAPEFRQDIICYVNMTIDEFLEQLDQHQETWRERAGYCPQAATQHDIDEWAEASVQSYAFEEALKVAITTPLPEAFECRRCLAEFSSNSQLHKHIRESHGKKTTASAAKSIAPHNFGLLTLTPAESTSKVTAISTPASASKSQPPPECSAASLNPNETTPAPPATPRALATRVTPLSVNQVTPQASLSADSVTTQAATPATLITSRSVTPPPTYRAVSPAPPTYETTSKNYLTMADLYMRYAPLKTAKSKSVQSSSSFHSIATRSRTMLPTLSVQDLYMRYAPLKSAKSNSAKTSWIRPMTTRSKTILPTLMVQDLYERFKKPVVRAAKWTPEYSTKWIPTFDFKQSMESSSHSIRSSAARAAYDPRTSQTDFFQASKSLKSNAKTRFSTMPKTNAQASTTQQPPHIKASKHDAVVHKLNNSVRGHVTSTPGLAVAATGPAGFRK